MWCENGGSIFFVLSQTTCVTEGWTDRITTLKTMLALLRRALKTGSSFILIMDWNGLPINEELNSEAANINAKTAIYNIVK